MGESVEILLRENPTTGFRWSLDPLRDADVSSEWIAGGAALGAGGRRRFLVQPLTPARHEIHLRLERSWNQEIDKVLDLTLVAYEQTSGDEGKQR